MWNLAVKSAWCKSTSSILSTNPKHIGSDNTKVFGFTWCWISQDWKFCQKVWVYTQSQKRCIRVSEFCSQKVQVSVNEIPILFRYLLVAIRLWRSLNWKVRNLVSLVQWNGKIYECFQLIEFSSILQSDIHFSWLFVGVEEISFIRDL